jgi:hypothetical protein
MYHKIGEKKIPKGMTARKTKAKQILRFAQDDKSASDKFLARPKPRRSEGMECLLVVVDAFNAEEAGALAQLFFNAKKLVVFRDAVGARS